MSNAFSVRQSPLVLSFAMFVCVILGIPCSQEANGQGSATNSLGNGGIHTIQGRLYVNNGQRSEIIGLRIRLSNYVSGEIVAVADSTGTFMFKNLLPGPYTIVVEGGDYYENAHESVFIDDPGSSNLARTIRLRGGTAKTANVQVFLKPKQSRETLGRAETINAKLATLPKAAVDLYEEAQRSISEKDYAKAITQLRGAVAIHRDFALAWVDLGVLLQRSGDSAGAIDAFRTAIKADPSSHAANLSLGCALYEEKLYKEAEHYLMQALVQNATSYRGHYYMGLTQVKLGRIDIAEQAFRTAIQVGDKQAAMAHYMLGGIYWSVKRYKEAADELEQYLQLEPNAKDAEKTRQSIAELRRKES